MNCRYRSLKKTACTQIGSERGAALLLVIVLSTIALLIMTTILYVITMGSQLSGSEKRYRTAHEAALGGIAIISQAIQSQSAMAFNGVNYQNSFSAKLQNGVGGFDTSIDINPNNPLTYDLTIDLGSPVYRVYVKMVQLKPGNTNIGYKTVDAAPGVVPASLGMGLLLPTYYTFEILSQSLVNPSERVRMSLVQVF